MLSMRMPTIILYILTDQLVTITWISLIKHWKMLKNVYKWNLTGVKDIREELWPYTQWANTTRQSKLTRRVYLMNQAIRKCNKDWTNVDKIKKVKELILLVECLDPKLLWSSCQTQGLLSTLKTPYSEINLRWWNKTPKLWCNSFKLIIDLWTYLKNSLVLT